MRVLVKFIVVFKNKNMRAIICAGWAGHSLNSLKKFITQTMPTDPLGLVEYSERNLLFVNVAPHAWPLERCACSIHHGGAGTTCAALWAGVPMIITPFTADQPMWAEWIHERGFGVKLDINGGQGLAELNDPIWMHAV